MSYYQFNRQEIFQKQKRDEAPEYYFQNKYAIKEK